MNEPVECKAFIALTVVSKEANLKDKFRSKFFEIGYISPRTPVSFIESSFLDLTRQACYPRSKQQLITMDLVSSVVEYSKKSSEGQEIDS